MLFRRHFERRVASGHVAELEGRQQRVYISRVMLVRLVAGGTLYRSVGREIAQSKQWLQSLRVADFTTSRAACRTAFTSSSIPAPPSQLGLRP